MKIYLNLASQPWRNRRPFFFLAGCLIVLSLAILAVSLRLYVDYQTKINRARHETIRIARMEDALKREEKQFAARAAALAKNLETEVEVANSIISDKSFSWSEFFSRLEKALPLTCYLNSLSFSRRADLKLEIKFKLVAPDFNSLLRTIEKLREAGFSGLQIQSENLSGKNIISEMVMIYEGTD